MKHTLLALVAMAFLGGCMAPEGTNPCPPGTGEHYIFNGQCIPK